jgi:hypothetical protein
VPASPALAGATKLELEGLNTSLYGPDVTGTLDGESPMPRQISGSRSSFATGAREGGTTEDKLHVPKTCE